MFNVTDLHLASELLEAIKFFNIKGWSPATSTNYSVRSQDVNNIIISKSGVDKGQFKITDLILIDLEANILSPFNKPGITSSAETEIHTAIYQRFSDVNCVLHTHSVLGTVLSKEFEKEAQLSFENLEILKGLSGNTTHKMIETLPIVSNSQDMKEIIYSLDTQLVTPLKIHGFLIAGHGLYTWGKDIATAKRHIETFEFLFECFNLTRKM